MSASCATCPVRHPDGGHLYCRRRAPAAEPVTGAAVWPRVQPTDLCAEHPDFHPLPPPAAQAALPL